MEEFKPHSLGSMKDLMDLIPQFQSIRPNTSIISPSITKPKCQILRNSRFTKTENHPILCKKCKKPKFQSTHSNKSPACNCKNLVYFPRKTQNNLNQSISVFPSSPSKAVFSTIKISLPMKARNFSNLTKKSEPRTINKMKSLDFTLDTPSSLENTMFIKKCKRREDCNKARYLVYKGNQSQLIKELMDLRSN